MASKKARWRAGIAGGLWGFAIGFAASVLLAVFITAGSNPFLMGTALYFAVPVGTVGGSLFGVFGTLRLLASFRIKWAAGIAVAVPGVLVGLVYSPFNPIYPPSDNTLIAHFNKHEADFDYLVGIIQRDKCYEQQIDEAATRPTASEIAGLSPSRIAEYHRLLHRVGIQHGFHATKTGSEIQFSNWVMGSAVSSEEAKGIVFLAHTPQKVYESLNGCYGKNIAYRHIKGSWYLFYEFMP